MRKILWLDLETTDSDIKRGGGVHQISYIIDIDGKVVKERNFKVAPFKNDLINATSLSVCGKTLEELRAYPPAVEAFKVMMNDIAPYKPMVIGGFNNAIFDNPMFQSWFFKCRNELKRYDLDLLNMIHFDPLDVRVLAVNHFLNKRDELFGFKLADVAKYLEIPIEEEYLHDAMYDITLTREIYYKLQKK